MKCSFPFNSKLFIDCCEKDVCERSFLSDNNIRHPLEAARSRIAFDWKTLLALVKTAFFVLFRSALIRGNEAALYWPTNTKNARTLSRPLKQNVRGNSNVYVYNMNLI